MIHRESQRLFIGPYVIDASRAVRVIPPGKMFGRLTGNARHLTDPANKTKEAAVKTKLAALLTFLLSMPEYQLQ